MKTKVTALGASISTRFTNDYVIGSVNEATSIEIGSVHKILVKFGLKQAFDVESRLKRIFGCLYF